MPLVQFRCHVLTGMPVRVTVGDSGLCLCSCDVFRALSPFVDSSDDRTKATADQCQDFVPVMTG